MLLLLCESVCEVEGQVRVLSECVLHCVCWRRSWTDVWRGVQAKTIHGPGASWPGPDARSSPPKRGYRQEHTDKGQDDDMASHQSCRVCHRK